jgi:hypothetical protein
MVPLKISRFVVEQKNIIRTAGRFYFGKYALVSG